ncbi:MAG: hypothetical protein CMK59_01715 [Proteobacteria bacterium]|nr:hypothetical protein [Pseudomonadota bacterium]
MNLQELKESLHLSKLSEHEIHELIAIGHQHQVDVDEMLIENGTEGFSFFVLLSGALSVSQQGQRVAVLSPGAIVGEMALFNNAIRVGSVQALLPSVVLEISTADFMPMVLHQEPVATKLMEHLGALMMKRLQKQDEALFQKAGEENPQLQPFISSFAPLKKKLMADWALKYHSIGRPGKLAITATKPSGTAQDLSVAYSPGVAEPCLAIQKNPEKAYAYTAKSQLVGVISNGTAVLGLGNIGPLASKPVMEGKAILFKKFADLDSFDIEVDELDPDRFIDIVCALEPTFGGVNLEDIRAPECFYIEEQCKKRMKVPVFHDDQHGTAIISGAGLLNALELVNKNIEDVQVVFSGAGAAGFSCARYFIQLGVQPENLIMTDINGVVYKGRGDNNYLDELAVETTKRTLSEAIENADVFMGASVGNLLKPEHLLSMNRDPIVFAMANPAPEIEYSLAVQTRSDVIMGTGRSDYPNQINNVIAFPFLFRGALDVRATTINQQMKRAASQAIAALAKEPITEAAGYDGGGLSYGRKYIIPKPFDKRLLVYVASAVAQAAQETGVALKERDISQYRLQLEELSSQL